MTSRGRLARGAVVALAGLGLAACVPAPPEGANGSGRPSPGLSTTSTTLATGPELLADARQFVYRVRSVACLATGSSFATAQGIVTNRHVASGSTSLQFSTWAGTDFSTALLALSTGPDLALLTGLPKQHGPPIDTADLVVGTPVWAAGYPLGDQLSVIPGTVVGYVNGAQYDEPGLVMEVTNPVQHGNSGGPLLDGRGQVVGIVVAIEDSNDDGLVIPASTLSSFLDAPGSATVGQCLI